MSLMRQVRERYCFEYANPWIDLAREAEFVTKTEANEAIEAAVNWALEVVSNEVARLAGMR